MLRPHPSLSVRTKKLHLSDFSTGVVCIPSTLPRGQLDALLDAILEAVDVMTYDVKPFAQSTIATRTRSSHELVENSS
jgi:hypothetical protein